MDLSFRLLGIDEPSGPAQSAETPSIEPTKDGFVGFCTNSAQQFSDFLLLIDRPDLRDDKELFDVRRRAARFHEWNEIVHAFTREQTTEDIVSAASALRIPVAQVNDGESVQRHEQLVARGVFVDDPSGGFKRPLPPYKIDGKRPPAPRPAPRLGEHSGRIEPRARPPVETASQLALPLAGIRIVDMTAWWAGPSATHMLACLGADVIHVESTGRMDAMRTTGGMLAHKVEAWWECSMFFLSSNTNKRGLTLDLTDPRGIEIMLALIATADAVVENFTPRVLDNFGLTWDAIRAANPRAAFVRMPAFGLDGPWRDHTGFAQTMEQLTGLAWLTGHEKDQPRIQRGPCDPLAGMHASFALLVALAERDATGRGSHVEVAMVEGALNAAAEQLVEFSAYGNRMQREGNRSPTAAPQGLYACADGEPGNERWLALSIATSDQWIALTEILDRPDWALDPALETLSGRRAEHARIDAALVDWIARHPCDPLVERLVLAGIPAARVRDPRTVSRNPQHRARGFYETSEHSVAGRHPISTVPFRYASVERWIRTPAPMLGQHNSEILTELGLSSDKIDALAADGIIGTRPRGV